MKKFIIFTLIYIILIIVTGIIAFKLEKDKYKQKNKKITLIEFFNNYSKITPKLVSVGLIFGICFGMMDNISLFFGINEVGPILKNKFNLDEFEVAGYSNAYSGFLGITFATFVTTIAIYIFPDVNQNELPIWINSLGFLIGCIIGIYIPKLFQNIF